MHGSPQLQPSPPAPDQLQAGSAAPLDPAAAANPGTRRRALVVLDFIPHYRKAIFEGLLESPDHDYTLAADLRRQVYPIEPWEPRAGDSVIHAPFVSLFRRRLGWVTGTVRLAARRDIDVVVFHANPYLLSSWAGAMVARFTGKRVLFYTIGWYHEESAARLLLKRIFYRLAHGLLLYGHWAKMIGIAQGLRPQRLYVVYNCLDYDRQKAIRAELDPSRLRQVRQELFAHPQRPTIICTSRLSPKRRLDQVLQAMSLLKGQGHEVNLILVGDGSERQNLQRRAAELELSVHFFGPCYDERRLAELIASCNATVAPGMVGLTAMHSLVYGTPVITHDDPMHQAPEWEAIWPGRNGGLFRRNDVADLARAIREWTSGGEFPSPEVRHACYAPIDRMYNPHTMRRVFDHAVGGAPADDLMV